MKSTASTNAHAPPQAGFPLVGLAYLSLTLSLIALLGLAVVVNKIEPILTADQPNISTSRAQTVTGKAVMFSDDLWVVRDTHGKGLLLQIGQATKGAGAVRVGDKIEALLSANGQVISIRKLPQ